MAPYCWLLTAPYGSQEAPQELSGGSLGTLRGPLGAHNLMASSMDRDFGVLWELHVIILTISFRSRGPQTSKMWYLEIYMGANF